MLWRRRNLRVLAGNTFLDFRVGSSLWAVVAAMRVLYAVQDLNACDMDPWLDSIYWVALYMKTEIKDPKHREELREPLAPPSSHSQLRL